MTGLSRRALILGGLSGLGVALAACAAKQEQVTQSSSNPPSTTTRPDSAPSELPEFAELEAKFGGRLGVYALDTGSGAAVGHRADERFLLCSTHKLLVAAAIIRLRGAQPGLLDRVIHYDRSKLLKYAPVTSQHVAEGMTVSALCQAAVTVSDNTAANLLVETLGGPPAVTAFARSLGDRLTHQDRIEPDLNVSAPGDERDTTTPAAIGADLRALVLGDALDAPGRDLLTGWLKANTTGDGLVRAGLPAGWPTGDKTGSGAKGEANDVAVTWPPGRAPLIISVYTVPADPTATTGKATVAAATRIAAKALGAA